MTDDQKTKMFSTRLNKETITEIKHAAIDLDIPVQDLTQEVFDKWLVQKTAQWIAHKTVREILDEAEEAGLTLVEYMEQEFGLESSISIATGEEPK